MGARFPQPPEKAVLPLKIYRLAATRDQVEVLKLFEKLYQRPRKKQALVVVADRGGARAQPSASAWRGWGINYGRPRPRCR